MPYLPAGQLVQDPTPPRLYWPAGHAAAVADEEPATQKNPAEQEPVQAAAVRPVVDPNRPAAQFVQALAPPTLNWPTAHRFVHAAVVSPVVPPKVPAGQAVQLAEPAMEYRPAAQMPPDGAPKADVEAAGHAYPAWQSPVQVLED